MGYVLYRMLRAGMPAEWTSGERLVALIIADDANDETRASWISNAQLCQETGLTPESLSKVLKRLAARGYEMRVAHGRGKDGRLVFATRGHATDYTVPILSPRPESPCDGTAFKQRKPVRQGVKARATARPLPSDPLNNQTPPQKMGVPSSHPEVEGNGTTPSQDPDFGGSNPEEDERNRQLTALEALMREQAGDPAAAVNGAAPARPCERCGQPISEAKQATAQYCGTRCKNAATKQRTRHRIAEGTRP